MNNNKPMKTELYLQMVFAFGNNLFVNLLKKNLL